MPFAAVVWYRHAKDGYRNRRQTTLNLSPVPSRRRQLLTGVPGTAPECKLGKLRAESKQQAENLPLRVDPPPLCSRAPFILISIDLLSAGIGVIYLLHRDGVHSIITPTHPDFSTSFLRRFLFQMHLPFCGFCSHFSSQFALLKTKVSALIIRERTVNFTYFDT